MKLTTRVLYLAWLLELALVICPFYFHIVCVYIYIGCVVLQWCLRSHCGISKSQMVNLIPTCIISSKKNYFRMILLKSEKQCIYMYKGRKASATAAVEE